MKLDIVAFKDVENDVEKSHRDDSSAPDPASARFNTCSHSGQDISPIIPESLHIQHVCPPWDPYMHSLWLPVVVQSQKLEEYYVFPLSSLVYEELKACFAAWHSRGEISEEYVNEAVQLWQGWLAHEEATQRRVDIKRVGSPNRSPPLRMLDGTRKWFFRLDQNSPKDSVLGHGPVSTLFDIVKRLTTSMRAFAAMKRQEQEAESQGRPIDIKVILTPWNEDMDPSCEFRVFVPPPGARGDCFKPEGLKIAAISQYRWFEPFPLDSRFTNLRCEMEVAEATTQEVLLGAQVTLHHIVEHIRISLREDLWTQLLRYGFTFDISSKYNRVHWETKLIEINPFGAVSGCGGCLFNWIENAPSLYGLQLKAEGVLFRMTLGEKTKNGGSPPL